jgi:hypothetical protein
LPEGVWSYPGGYGQRKELWASLVEEALAGREGRHEARLRALLGGA